MFGAWYEKYTPTTIEDFIFESDANKKITETWIKQNYIDGNLLLCGTAGTGKTSLTNILVDSLIPRIQMKNSNKQFRNSHLFKQITARTVTALDELIPWIRIKPDSANVSKKILVIEEIDKASPEFKGTLKDSTMEKYQDVVTFIATTNYNDRLDAALLSRFNYKFIFNNKFNKNDVLIKLKSILTNENIEYSNDVLEEFVDKYNLNLRELINNLQILSASGTLVISDTNIMAITDLEQIINHTVSIIKKVKSDTSLTKKEEIVHDIEKSIISNEWMAIYSLVSGNTLINYNRVYELLFEYFKNNIILLQVLEKYSNKENVKFHNINYMAFLVECIKML